MWVSVIRTPLRLRGAAAYFNSSKRGSAVRAFFSLASFAAGLAAAYLTFRFGERISADYGGAAFVLAYYGAVLGLGIIILSPRGCLTERTAISLRRRIAAGRVCLSLAPVIGFVIRESLGGVIRDLADIAEARETRNRARAHMGEIKIKLRSGVLDHAVVKEIGLAHSGAQGTLDGYLLDVLRSVYRVARERMRQRIRLLVVYRSIACLRTLNAAGESSLIPDGCVAPDIAREVRSVAEEVLREQPEIAARIIVNEMLFLGAVCAAIEPHIRPRRPDGFNASAAVAALSSAFRRPRGERVTEDAILTPLGRASD
jgi:hypothetical protein